ncbi:Stk1 family PASTA domain-containing Ser/Thr kinase [Streptomyces sp. KLOTTS4A1]|uniref:Stk1 family PASTA domain-containing Ser/Thr kinase n=1 Tax=Streptomyces sp. KLOTTS4A1 TaxID=3390996 RepID=UPI0039F5E608
MDTTLQDPLVGQVLDGRYRIDARIAVGGMATVYRAVDTRLDRVLALKVMHPTLAADAAFVDRFIREAKSVARLAHPNVVAVFDQGAQGAYVYLAMEYVAGCTLRDVLRERGALQPRAALDILEPVLAALGAAHRAGFVHRDMKPENVLIGDDGRVKVADFGLVRSVDTVTNTTGAVLGTVSYLAPEQIERGIAEPSVDVYACGVMLYEMLTGTKPHAGESPAQILYKHLHEDVPPPSAAVPGLPVDLDELVATATARSPELRPYDAVALLGSTRQARAALSEAQLDAVPPAAFDQPAEHDIAEDRTSVIPRAVPRPLPADEDRLNRTSRLEMPPAGPPQAPAGRRAAPTRPGRRGMYTVIAAVLLAIGIGTGVWYINSGQFTQVPLILAKSEADARKRLEDAGLRVDEQVNEEYSNTYERGQVMGSDPEQGKRIREGGTVTLTVSLGQRIVRVPDVSGSTLAEAKQKLAKAGLEAGAVTREFSGEVPSGSVIRTDPSSGTRQQSGTTVELTVSKGEPIEVPDVTGETPDEARDELRREGLKVEIAPERVYSDHDKGLVAEQTPGSGASLGKGETITLTLSKGQEMIEVPDVTGLKVGEARTALEARGFKVDEDRGFLGLFGDTVDSQSVQGGEEAPKGSTITIKIR